MDIIMSHVANVTGLNLGDIRLTDLNYADDAVLLTDDPSQLLPALQCLEEEASISGYMCPGPIDEGLEPWLRTRGNSNHG